MELSKAIEQYNADRTHAKARAALAQAQAAVQGRPFFFLGEAGVVVPDKTLRAEQLLRRQAHVTAVPGAKTWDEVLAAGEEPVTDAACPVTGALLFDDQSATNPQIDYAGVPRDLRCAVGLAALRGHVSGIQAAADVAYLLRRRGQLPEGRVWDEAQAEWARLDKETHRGDADDQTWRAVLRRLVYAAERDTTLVPMLPRPTVHVPLPALPLPAAPPVGGADAVALPLVAILASGARGEAARQELAGHLIPGQRAGRYRLWAGIRPGAIVEQEMAQILSTATVLVVLVNVEALANAQLMQWCGTRRATGRRLFPVRLTDLADWQLDDSPFARLEFSPRAKAITGYQDRNTAWSEVVNDIRNALTPR